jgi:hypothetical protein
MGQQALTKMYLLLEEEMRVMFSCLLNFDKDISFRETHNLSTLLIEKQSCLSGIS